MFVLRKDGVNALHIAAFAGYNETVGLLIKNNVNVNAADNVRMIIAVFVDSASNIALCMYLDWGHSTDVRHKTRSESGSKFSSGCRC